MLTYKQRSIISIKICTVIVNKYKYVLLPRQWIYKISSKMLAWRASLAQVLIIVYEIRRRLQKIILNEALKRV